MAAPTRLEMEKTRPIMGRPSSKEAVNPNADKVIISQTDLTQSRGTVDYRDSATFAPP